MYCGRVGVPHELRARVVNWLPLRSARLRCERESVSVVLSASFRRVSITVGDAYESHRFGCSSQLCTGRDPRERPDEESWSFRHGPSGGAHVCRDADQEEDVVLEATGNTAVIVRLLMPFVHRVAIANPMQVRAIAWAKVKTDKIDAATLARQHAAQFLPEVWMPTEDVVLQRRCIAERAQLVSQTTRLKNRMQSILFIERELRQAGGQHRTAPPLPRGPCLSAAHHRTHPAAVQPRRARVGVGRWQGHPSLPARTHRTATPSPRLAGSAHISLSRQALKPPSAAAEIRVY
ncbi:IS110 family transposase [Variovorax brevis]|uniref:IS110 family transposase n=1 Tax=Variovorax brevis TaxID=3053503 RepID=UPI0033659CA3